MSRRWQEIYEINARLFLLVQRNSFLPHSGRVSTTYFVALLSVMI